MGIITKFIGNNLVGAAIKSGHIPAGIPSNEKERLEDLGSLKLVEQNIHKDKR